MLLKIKRNNVLILGRSYMTGDVVEVPDDRARVLIMQNVADKAETAPGNPSSPPPTNQPPLRQPAIEAATKPVGTEKAVSRR